VSKCNIEKFAYFKKQNQNNTNNQNNINGEDFVACAEFFSSLSLLIKDPEIRKTLEGELLNNYVKLQSQFTYKE
jgi:hypothetical protein